MSERPVRLVVADDGRRSRLTVFFRLFLAVPHFFWVWLWSFGVAFTAPAQWIVTVVRGRPAQPLQEFHLRYVRYLVHLGAFLSLAANPFPGFLGDAGYPIDVELDAAERQRRLSAAFRLLLTLPPLLMLAVLNPLVAGPFGLLSAFVTGGVIVVVAFLGWFAALVLGRTPPGLRNLAAYVLRYTGEVFAYVLLVTRVYPSTDPTLLAEAGAPPPHPVRLVVDDDRRRSRLTTFFRFFLAVPHFVWLMLWSLAVAVAVFLNWFVVLARGRSAASLHRFVAAWLRYQTHVGSYLFLIANPFPGFTGAPGFPIDVDLPAAERQRRLVTLFRFPLMLPAAFIGGALQTALAAAAVGGWLAALVIGRMPEGLRNLGAHALRYNAQTNAYLTLLTDRYPFAGPPTQPPLDVPAELAP